MPTSATDWKYDPSPPAGSRASAWNWAAMYLAASRPPRVAGARPSSRSSAKYFRCASIAAVFTAGSGGSWRTAVEGGSGVGHAAVARAATPSNMIVRMPKEIRLLGPRQGVIFRPMLAALRSRRVEKLPDHVVLRGRILFLAEDAGLVRRQLEGQDIDWQPATKLRDNISSDEITPAYICYYYDETLGDFPYLGLKCGDEFPISRGAVKRAGFVASVSGQRRGKGSSREQSPYAEMCAGIKLVVAQNIERIYRENCQNLGVLTTTDFSIIDRVRRGETIPLSAFTAGEGEITRGIIEHGGLFNFNVARLQGNVVLSPPATPPRPMTLGEKIIARHWVVDPSKGTIGVPAVKPGEEGFVVTAVRFIHAYVTPMAAIFFEQRVGPDERVLDPGSILMFRDHLTFLGDAMTPERVKEGLLDVALELEKKQRAFAQKQGIRLYGELRLGHHGSEAICHSKILEAHALPGQVIIGSDSHTPHAGAVGCVRSASARPPSSTPGSPGTSACRCRRR